MTETYLVLSLCTKEQFMERLSLPGLELNLTFQYDEDIPFEIITESELSDGTLEQLRKYDVRLKRYTC